MEKTVDQIAADVTALLMALNASNTPELAFEQWIKASDYMRCDLQDKFALLITALVGQVRVTREMAARVVAPPSTPEP